MLIVVANVEAEKIENTIVGVRFPIASEHIVLGNKVRCTWMKTGSRNDLEAKRDSYELTSRPSPTKPTVLARK